MAYPVTNGNTEINMKSIIFIISVGALLMAVSCASVPVELAHVDELRESNVSARSFKSVSLNDGIVWAESEMNRGLPEAEKWQFEAHGKEGDARSLSSEDLEQRTFSAELKAEFPVYYFLELIAFNTGTVFTVEGRKVTFFRQISH